MPSMAEVLPHVTATPATTRAIGTRLYGRAPTTLEMNQLAYALGGLIAHGVVSRRPDPQNPRAFLWQQVTTK